MPIWIETTPDGHITQAYVGDATEDPLGDFWGTHRRLDDADLASLAQAIVDDAVYPEETLQQARDRIAALTAEEIHRNFIYRDGEFFAKPQHDRGKVYYPDTKHYIFPKDRGKGPIAVNTSPPGKPSVLPHKPIKAQPDGGL